MTIVIFKKSKDKDGNAYNQALRKVSVSKDFVGITKKGLNHAEFDNLAKDLEPSSTGWYFTSN